MFLGMCPTASRPLSVGEGRRFVAGIGWFLEWKRKIYIFITDLSVTQIRGGFDPLQIRDYF